MRTVLGYAFLIAGYKLLSDRLFDLSILFFLIAAICFLWELVRRVNKHESRIKTHNTEAKDEKADSEEG